MNWKPRSALLAAVISLSLSAAACGSSPSTSSTTPKGTITVAGFKFSEGSVLAELYGQALQHDGYTVTFKLNLGSREVVGPAIKSSQVDLYIGYAATDLEFYNNSAGEASGDVTATTSKLNSHLQPLNLVALNPSSAVDQNAFAMTKANSTKYNATKLSDLAAIGGQLVLGAGPECPTRPFCQLGLQKTYGINFKSFKALDTDGPLTRAALKNNDIQVGLVFSSDADLSSLGLVTLQDDKHLENADNVVPIVRTPVATAEVKKVLNAVSAGLTTADLVNLNSQVELQHMDPDVVTKAYLQQHNYFG
ncbi:MAG: ABC transporter substrate-binding protein [Chloroflexi bacterium]|nr:MAG: ABC transporter substrate-binding protein [Chloroflexota bacterium]TME40834.1 MAG: ABC transporter substrate-binding protein [Chloroflexota bacterium]TME51045.1 MAG: ABC transporter substrate-binding protein [Chloroflexota bacterium]